MAQSSNSSQTSLPLLKAGVFEIVFVIAAIIFFFGLLNYFNIISLSKLYPNKLGSLPHRPFSEPAQTQNFTAKPESTLGCPVPDQYCDSGQKVTYNDNLALAYDLPSGTEVKSIATIDSSLRFGPDPIGLYQAFIQGEECNSVTYTLSSTSQPKKIDLLPLEKGSVIATAGASTIRIDRKAYNLIVQMQKKALDPSTVGKPGFIRCTIKNLDPKDFGTYQELNNNTFK